MYEEIGSNFWLDRHDELEAKEISLDFLQINIHDVAFLSTGRSAIAFLLEHIGLPKDKKVALLPPFTCRTVIQPFMKAGYRVCHYGINEDLTCDADSLVESIEKNQPSIVLVHGYFGFDTLRSIKEVVLDMRSSGIVVIEDITHTMYSSFEHTESDYYVSSLRKWVALPDGALAISTNRPFAYKPSRIDEDLQEAKLQAFHAKYLYMCEGIGNKDEFLRRFGEAEQILCKQESIFAMSLISKKIQANLRLDTLRKKRRENFKALVEHTRNLGTLEPIFDSLCEDITPLYFPVYIKQNRKEFQSYLAENNIYAPILWPKPSECAKAIPPTADWVYQHILSIPCDQRYGLDDMQRIAETIMEFDSERLQVSEE